MPALLALTSAHDAEITQRRIETPEEADELRFLGSPSVRVDGRDIEPGAESRIDYGMKCRLYRSPTGLSENTAARVDRARTEPGDRLMGSRGCCGPQEQTARLNDQQRVARMVIGLGSLALAARARRTPGALSSVCAVGAGWFGLSTWLPPRRATRTVPNSARSRASSCAARCRSAASPGASPPLARVSRRVAMAQFRFSGWGSLVSSRPIAAEPVADRPTMGDPASRSMPGDGRPRRNAWRDARSTVPRRSAGPRSPTVSTMSLQAIASLLDPVRRR